MGELQHEPFQVTFPREPDAARCPAYVGVDVAFAKGKYLPISVCVRQEGRLTPLPLKDRPGWPRGSGNVAALEEHIVQQFARDTATFLEKVSRDENLQIVRIAIDAPSDYRAEDVARRSAEKAMDEEGISCFTTPSRSDFEKIQTGGQSPSSERRGCVSAASLEPTVDAGWIRSVPRAA